MPRNRIDWSRLMRNSRLCILVVTLPVLGCNGSNQSVDRQAGSESKAATPDASLSVDVNLNPTSAKVVTRHLPNVVRLHAKVLSGGAPDGDMAFEELRELGVRTVVSVDGAKPDVARATKFGLKYVHLPHGYDGISEVRQRELAKAVTELDGPIFIHCHHGKHRSPAAAVVACVGAGLMDPANAHDVLVLAGTNPHYRGLFQVAESSRRFKKELLAEWDVDFRETQQLPPMAATMVTIEHIHDQILKLGEANWATLADHPDLDPAHVALILREHFMELLRLEQVDREPAEFRALVQASIDASAELENGLRQLANGNEDMAQQGSLAVVHSAAKRISDTCVHCHTRFRDVPRKPFE